MHILDTVPITELRTQIFSDTLWEIYRTNAPHSSRVLAQSARVWEEEEEEEQEED